MFMTTMMIMTTMKMKTRKISTPCTALLVTASIGIGEQALSSHDLEQLMMMRWMAWSTVRIMMTTIMIHCDDDNSDDDDDDDNSDDDDGRVE